MKNLTKNKQRDVFRKKFKKKKKLPLWRQTIESIVLFISGTYLLYYINLIPQKIDWQNILNTSWSNLIESLQILSQSIINFLLIFIVLVLIVIGFFLLFAGIIRFVRLLIILSNRRKRNAKYSSILRNK